MQAHSLINSDGIRLLAETGGDGPTMLLCNGLFCTTQYYPPWWRHFGGSHRLVQFDYRSHGGSDDDPHPSNVTMDKLVDDASLVFERLCDERTIVVGHSMGVRVAIELFIRYPNRVPCLILLCGSAFDSLGSLGRPAPVREAVLGLLRVGDRVVPVANALKDVVIRRDIITKVGTLLGGMSARTPRDAIDGLLTNVDRLDVRMMTGLARSYIQHSVRDLLPDVHVPVLYLVGERDSLASPSHADDVVRCLPDAEKYVVRGCTHLAPVEQPDEVGDVVEAFLRRVSSRRAQTIQTMDAGRG